MISFAANQYPMKITNDQLSTIYRLSAGQDVEVVDHEPSPIVEVYVGDLRHHVDEDGRILFTEHGTEANGWDWMPVDHDEPELGEVFKDGTVTVRLIGEPGKTMGYEHLPRHEGHVNLYEEPGLRTFFEAALVRLVDRLTTVGLDDMEVDMIPDKDGECPDLLINISFGG